MSKQLSLTGVKVGAGARPARPMQEQLPRPVRAPAQRLLQKKVRAAKAVEEAVRALSLAPAAKPAAAPAASEPADGAGGDARGTGEVVVRYNHYAKAFPVVAGVLDWREVDAEYALSFVFKGAFAPFLVQSGTGRRMAREGALFSGLALGVEYRIGIEEDPVEAAKPTRPFVPLGRGTEPGRVLPSSNGGADGMLGTQPSAPASTATRARSRTAAGTGPTASTWPSGTAGRASRLS